MKKTLVILWLFLAAGGAAFHFGPGQKWKLADDLGRALEDAERHAAQGEWAQAIERYDFALQHLPQHRRESIQRVRLGKARARMFVGELPEAYDDLEGLLDELGAEKPVNRPLVEETRAAFANAQYYMTWLLRLEGAPEAEWSPVVEGARQNYRLLAESRLAAGDGPGARRMKEDLDSTIRLARMDLSELQALPLPSQ